MGMMLLSGDEGPAEIAVLAYGMEEGLRAFYEILASQVGDAEVAEALTKLAAIEEKHKEKLFTLYKTFDPSVDDRKMWEHSHQGSTVLEGGFEMEDFIKENEGALTSPTQVLETALMIEVQALDLYLRYSHRINHEEAKGVLFRLAEDEKQHLKALGALLDRKI